jgi:hypothetical protein
MDNLNYYRSICPSELAQLPVVNLYKEVIIGKRKVLPSGTWEKGENVIIIVRYALEVHLDLKKEQIPKINRAVIKEQKLWGALNRFKSVRKLIQFVYPGRYNEFDFSRVPINYWNNIQNIRDRLEWHLCREGIRIVEIPRKVNYDLLVEWGFSNPLKRHGHSPYRFMNALYPGRFKETDFKKIPQGYAMRSSPNYCVNSPLIDNMDLMT